MMMASSPPPSSVLPTTTTTGGPAPETPGEWLTSSGDSKANKPPEWLTSSGDPKANKPPEWLGSTGDSRANKPPEWLGSTGDPKANWLQWKRQFGDYLRALGLDAEPGGRKVALMLTTAGPVAIEAYNSMLFERPGDGDKMKTVLHMMDVHFCTRNRSEPLERFSFRARLQLPGEAFDTFLSDLKAKVQKCHYGALTHSLVRDQVVCGVRDAELRERLLREPRLTLEGAVKLCRAAETLSAGPATSLVEAAAAAAHTAVSPPRRKNEHPSSSSSSSTDLCKACGGPWLLHPALCPATAAPLAPLALCKACRGPRHQQPSMCPAAVCKACGGPRHQPSECPAALCKACGASWHPAALCPSALCKSCGEPWHPPAECPAAGTKCTKCGKNNHYAKACWKTRRERKRNGVAAAGHEAVEGQQQASTAENCVLMTGDAAEDGRRHQETDRDMDVMMTTQDPGDTLGGAAGSETSALDGSALEASDLYSSALDSTCNLESTIDFID